MEYQVAVREMSAGKQFEGYYLLKSALVKNSTSGRPFLSCVIADCTGEIEAKMWDYSGSVHDHSGSIIKVRGEISEYKGALQATLMKARRVKENDVYALDKILPCAPIDIEAMNIFIKQTLRSITDNDYRTVCEEIFTRNYDKFATIPAGKTIHHSFIHGLMMHTGNMMKTAVFLADLYSEVIDRDLLLAGTFLHDLAKIEEFEFSDCSIVTDYSIKGQLLGHLVLGAQKIAEVCTEFDVPEEKTVLLQHMVLSHHGEPEFGAAVRPHCAESELLSLIDLIDSRMEIYQETLNSVPVGSFSQKIYALDKKIYHHG